MPSKEDICVVQETIADKKDYFPTEVEDLVAAIKHNLQLKSRPRYGACSKQRRMSPYSAPVRTVCKYSGDKENSSSEHSTQTCKYCIIRTKAAISHSSDDPYEMLQELIKKGSLIKEAVKRIQFDTDRKSKKDNFYEFDDYEVQSPHLGIYDI